jgi:hypothetical protein
LAAVSIDKEVLQPFDTAHGFGGNTQHLASEQTGTAKGFYTTGQQSASLSHFAPMWEWQVVQPDPLDA